MGVKKSYAPEFKAKIAIEAIRGEKGSAEICSQYNIPSTNLHQWKDKAIESLHQVFIPESEYMRRQKIIKDQIEQLHKIIGEITIENNYLKKKLQM